MADAPHFDDFHFQWDAEIENHTKAKGLRPGIIEAVIKRAPIAFPNKEDRTGSHLVIGPIVAGDSGRLSSFKQETAAGGP